MRNRPITGLILILCLLAVPAAEGQDSATPFDEQAAWQYIKDLAADAMLGRKSGQPGGVMGEEYIAAKFEEWGLEPAGDEDTYFQHFTIEHRNIEEGVVFRIKTDAGERDLVYGDDWRVQRYSGSGHFTAELVFAGYGIHAPDKGYDDYENVDVRGKLVLMTTGVPRKFQDKLEEEADMNSRIKAARKHGAAGIIGFQPPSDSSRYFRLRVDKEIYDPGFVLLSADNEAMDYIFKNLNTERDYLFEEIERKGEPQSFATGVDAFISVNAVFDPERQTRNVLAKITGTDRSLRNEYIVIGAHMDHLGIGATGDVYNGANDNASGTAVVMELARVMKQSPDKPRRTVIFALWAGEEQGLLGSYYYADHPTHPIETTVTYINLDMVAHGNGNVPFRGEYYGPEIWNILKPRLPESMAEYVKPERGGPGGSDHTPFLMKGVPAYAIMTEGHHFKYHHPRDDADLIQPELLKRVGDFVLTAVNILADEPGELIQDRRQEWFYLKYIDAVNFKINSLDQMLEDRSDVTAPYVDLQLSAVSGEEGLSGNEALVSLVNTLLGLKESFQAAENLSLFTGYRNLSRAVRQGQTSIMPGLNRLSVLQDNPEWGRVLARQGLYFIRLDDPSVFFQGDGWSAQGETLFRTLNQSGLLLILSDLNDIQSRLLLEASEYPVVILNGEMMAKDAMDLIKKTGSVLGLTLLPDRSPEQDFAMLDAVKEAVGAEHVMLVNQDCLWSQKGADSVLDVIPYFIDAEYDRRALSLIFSQAFFQILDRVRGSLE